MRRLVLALLFAACVGDDLCELTNRCEDRDTHCDDGTTPICRIATPMCDPDSILAHRDSCFVCVNPHTCEPWGVASCMTDHDCGLLATCDPCGSSSCPACQDCVPACR